MARSAVALRPSALSHSPIASRASMEFATRSLTGYWWLVGESVIVGDQGAFDGGVDAPVEPDRGVEGQEALDDAGPEPGRHSSAVSLQAKLVLQGPDDRLHALAQPVGKDLWVVFVGACRADHAQAQLGEERLGVLAGQALVGDDRRTSGWPVGRLVGQQLPGLLALAPQLGVGQAEPGHGAVNGDDQHELGAPVEAAVGGLVAVAGVAEQPRALDGAGGLAALQ